MAVKVFTKYPKIHSIYKREEGKGKKKKMINGDWSLPEFEYLANLQWEATEKVNGTNIRIYWGSKTRKVEFRGKTDDAQIPAPLLRLLLEKFPAPKFEEKFNKPGEDYEVIICGEGYGVNIQSEGRHYNPKGVDIILFDVYINGFWLNYESLSVFASQMGLDVVPLVGYMTIPEAIDYCRKGFVTQCSRVEGTDMLAEGLVLKPKVPLLFRKDGSPIITKVKTWDLRRMFGDV